MTNVSNLEKLKRARFLFESFRKDLTTEKDKVATVQAFEFCYEISWKTIKKFLESEGLEATTPKEVFRKAAVAHLIEDPERWFGFQKVRNLTTHTYEEETLEEVVGVFDFFSTELEKLIVALEVRL